MQERSDKMTSEMKTFKNRMYHSFIYINLLWIVICSIVQIFGHKLKIYIFSEAFVSKSILIPLLNRTVYSPYYGLYHMDHTVWTRPKFHEVV